jgi:hypothetical protein
LEGAINTPSPLLPQAAHPAQEQDTIWSHPNCLISTFNHPNLLIFGESKEEIPIYIFTKGISFPSPFAWGTCA